MLGRRPFYFTLSRGTAMRGIEYEDQAEQVMKLTPFVEADAEKAHAIHAVIVAMHLRAIKEAAISRT